MQTTFLNAAGTVLFTRDDMEQGNWTQEEYTVNATFPFVAGKVIERGQRLSIRDPATDSIEVFEIRNVNNNEPEHYQQIIAEHIAVSELSDEHINNKEITNKTPKQALDTVLSGTLWAAGNMGVSRTSSVDIGRGSVWQAVGAIAQNWNVYITPRVTINTAGAITGRYLDVTESTGVWRGLRLSLDKNMADASVVYDDSETYTALYGYGGNVDTAQQSGDDTRQELTFASVVWTATSSHPAKPAGQTYIEDPQATALYGRNGRPRFGYYQNSSITDPAILLQKTWESLKLSSKPKVNISGTVSDLYRLGYKDQPIRLHDLVIVDVPETGESFYLQIIKNDVDLIDPTATRPEIGDYIANIIYINRETESYATTGKASGGGGGGGGRGGGNETNLYNTFSALEKNTDEYGSMIGMVVGKRNGNNYIKAGEIALSINSTSGESTALINASHVNISATNDIHTLAGDIEHDADGKLVIKNAGGMYVQRTESGVTSQFGVFDNGNLTGGVVVDKINGQTGTITRLKGSTIVIGDDQTIDSEYRGQTLDGTLTAITSDFTTVHTLLADKIEAEDVTADMIKSRLAQIQTLTTGTITCAGLSTGGNLSATGAVTGSGVYLSGGGSLANAIASFGTATPSGGTIMIPTTKVDGTAGPYINFSIADTQYYQDGVSAARTAGYVAGEPKDVSLGSKIQGSKYYVDIIRKDDTSRLLELDLSTAYADARNGYTLGTFTQATVTPQGTATTVTPIGTSSVRIATPAVTRYKAGTLGGYYKGNGGEIYGRGDSIKLYTAGTVGGYFKGNGGSITGRGNAITRYKAGESKTYYLRNTSSGKQFTHYMNVQLYRKTGVDTYTSAGNHDWWYAGSGTNYYTANGSVTVTLQGEAETVYDGSGTSGYLRGDSINITPIGEKQTVYKGNGTHGYLRGDSINITPIGDAVTCYEFSSSGTNYYTAGDAVTLYGAGTTDSTTYFTKS